MWEKQLKSLIIGAKMLKIDYTEVKKMIKALWGSN